MTSKRYCYFSAIALWVGNARTVPTTVPTTVATNGPHLHFCEETVKSHSLSEFNY